MDVRASRRPSRGLHTGVEAGEGTGREPGRAGARTLFTPRLRVKNCPAFGQLGTDRTSFDIDQLIDLGGQAAA